MRSVSSLFGSSSSGEPMAFGRRRRALSTASATKKKARAMAAINSKKITPTSVETLPSSTVAARKKAKTTTTTTTPSTTTTTTTSTTSSVLNNTVTTTSCNERLHYVLARKSKEALASLSDSLRAHAGVKTVCVYTDSPLVSRAPLSQRQQKIMLTCMSEACTKMTTLQLDFSSEFGPQTEVILDCELLATILQNAQQLESLLLKDVSLKGNVQVLEQVLLDHKHLAKIELKWCTEVIEPETNTEQHELIDASNQDATANQPDQANQGTQPDQAVLLEQATNHADPDDLFPSSSSILPSLITTLSEMEHLQELTLLVSSAHNLPLPQLAHSKTLKRLTLGLEQRHVTSTTSSANHATTTAQSILQRHAEQVLLVQFLEALKYNDCLQECTLFSHHWKSSMTLSCVCELVGSTTSVLKQLSLTDYNYGSDDPRKLLELASVLQTNKHLQRFKLITKKRVSSNVDKKTRKANTCMIDTAFVETLEQNFTLQYLDIAHAGIHISDTPKSHPPGRMLCKACCRDTGGATSTCTASGAGNGTAATNSNCSSLSLKSLCCLEQPHKPKYMIPFFLMTNRHFARQRFSFPERVQWSEWKEFVVQNADNTPLLFFLLQANPSLLLPALSGLGMAANTCTKNGQLAGRHIWEYYF